MAYKLEPGLYNCSRREHSIRVTSSEIFCSFNQLCQVCISGGVWSPCEVFSRADLSKRQTIPMNLAEMAGTETAALLTGTDGSVERPLSQTLRYTATDVIGEPDKPMNPLPKSNNSGHALLQVGIKESGVMGEDDSRLPRKSIRISPETLVTPASTKPWPEWTETDTPFVTYCKKIHKN